MDVAVGDAYGDTDGPGDTVVRLPTEPGGVPATVGVHPAPVRPEVRVSEAPTLAPSEDDLVDRMVVVVEEFQHPQRRRRLDVGDPR